MEMVYLIGIAAIAIFWTGFVFAAGWHAGQIMAARWFGPAHITWSGPRRETGRADQ